MRRYLSGRSVTLSHTFLDDDEATITPAAVTVTVTRAGSTTATVQGPATLTGGKFTFTAGLLSEGVYTVRWDGATYVDTVLIESVGAYLFSAIEARQVDPDLTVQKYTSEKVREAREAVETEFQRITGRSFTPRTVRLTLDHDGSDFLVLPVRDVRAVSSLVDAAGAPVTVTLGVEEFGALTGLSALPEGYYSLDVAYGFAAVPEDIKRAGITRLRSLLHGERSGIPDRATTFQAMEGGTFTLATPGRGGSETGIPDVDAILARYTYRVLDSVAWGLL